MGTDRFALYSSQQTVDYYEGHAIEKKLLAPLADVLVRLNLLILFC